MRRYIAGDRCDRAELLTTAERRCLTAARRWVAPARIGGGVRTVTAHD